MPTRAVRIERAQIICQLYAIDNDRAFLNAIPGD